MLLADTLRSLGGALALAALIAPLTLTAQNRDFGAERVNLDDAAGDGGFNTLTLQVPPAGLSANRILTFPDADGSIITLGAPLAANQILFGGPAGQAEQSPIFLWDVGAGQFNIGAGNFTVDAASGNVAAAGTITSGSGALVLDGVSPSKSLATTAGDLVISPVTGNLFITAPNITAGGGLFTITPGALTYNGPHMQMPGILDVDNLGGLNLLTGLLTVDPLGMTYTGPQFLIPPLMDLSGGGLDLFTSAVIIDPTGTISSTGAGSSFGSGADATQLTVNGVVGVGAYEVQVNGDAQVTGELNVGTLNLGLTSGSVPFGDGAGALDEDNTNLFWDDVNNRLGVGTNTPSTGLAIVRSDATIGLSVSQTGGANAANLVANSAGSNPALFAANLGTAGAIFARSQGNEPTVTGFNTVGTGTAGNFVKDQGGNPVVDVTKNGAGNGIGLRVRTFNGNADGVEVTVTGTGLGLDVNGGAIDGDSDANALGDGGATTQLTVRGTADAVGTETLPNAVFDLAVNGDIAASGIIKSGAGVWLDGVSATHSVTADQPLNVQTIGANALTLSTNSVNAVSIDGTTQNVTIANDLGVTGTATAATVTDGTASMTGGVISDGAGSTMTGGTVTGTTVTDGTASMTGGTISDGAGGTLAAGVLTAGGSGSIIGDGTDAEQLQIAGVNGGAVEVDVNGDMDVSGSLSVGTLMLNGDLDMDDNDIFNIDELRGNSATGDLNVNTTNTGDINLGNGTGDVNADANILPAVDDTYDLGSPTLRWQDIYVGPATIHIGSNADEAEISFVGGNLEFDGDDDASVDMSISGTTGEVTIENELRVNNNLIVTGGDIDTDQDLVAGGDITAGNEIEADGAILGNAAGNEFGDGNDALQLTVDGVNGGAIELQVNGDADVTGSLSVGTLMLNGDLDMDDNDIFNIDELRGNSATGNLSLNTTNAGNTVIGNGTGTVGVAGNTTVTGSLTVVSLSDFQGPIGSTSGNLQIGDYFIVNGDGTTNLLFTDGSIERNSGAVETLSIDNTGAGDVNLLLNGATSTTNSRLTIDDGHWTSQQTTGPVSAVAGANVTTAALSNETDVAGIIDITTSGVPAAGAQATVTFDAAYGTAPIVVLTAANGAGAGIGAYVTRTTTTFTINFIGVPAASTSYQFYYQVIETQ